LGTVVAVLQKPPGRNHRSEKGDKMKRLVLVLIVFALMLLGFASSALCAQIIGKVADAQGTPVTNVDIAVSDAHGKTVRIVRPDQKGIFAVNGLAPGEYQAVCHPAEGGSLGGIVQFHLGSSGITIIWRIRPKQSSLVLAPRRVNASPATGAIGSLGLEHVLLSSGISWSLAGYERNRCAGRLFHCHRIC
jgi:hypothetical protein